MFYSLTADQLHARLKQKDFFLLDVRTEADQWLPQTDLQLSYDQMDKLIKLLPPDQPMVVYCRSGNTSQTAAQQLSKLGYQSVYNLTGGIIAWQQRNFPTVNQPPKQL